MISLKIGPCLQAVGTAFLLAASGLSAQTAAILPFETDFESDEGYTLGPLASDAWWQIGSGLDASIVAPGAASSQTLNFFGVDSLDLFTDSGNAPVSWIDFYLKPVFVDPLELPEVIETEQSAVTGFVKVNTQGEVYAIDGDGLGGGSWVPSGELRNLQGNQGSEVSADWIRLTYRLDYTTKKWDLFVDGEMVMVDLGFLDQSILSLGSFSARADGETATQLDYFYAGNENPLYVDTSNDGLPDDWLTAQGLSIYSNQRSGDSDQDGLDNLLEYRIASDAGNPDSDGDGVNDGAEYFAGADPVAADVYSLSALPFTEDFEAYASGSLGTQGNWTVVGNSAEIQSTDVWDGSSALSLDGDTSASNALDGFGQSVVWIDLYLKPTAASESPDLAGDAAVGYYFNEEGRPIVFDGSGGNGSGFWKLLDAAQSSDWRRVTVKMDYGAQAYDFYLDGERLGAGLGFAHAQPFISRISAAGTTMVDDIFVDTVEPAALDDDRDGSTNADEIAAGTNPAAFDSDGDGLADSLEILWGFDPNVGDATLAQPIEVTSDVYVWTTSFAVSEGYTSGVLAGQNGWTASGQNEVTTLEEASISDDPATDTVLERMAGMGELRRVWISFRAKLIAGDLPTLESDADSFAGAFGASSDSKLAVWDNVSENWGTFTTSADLTEWNDYALYFDYVDQVWTLCLNGVIVADGLPFRDQNLVTFSRFKALQAKVEEATADFEPATAYFDDIRFANTEPANMDFDGDGLLNGQERQLGSDLYSSDTDGDSMDDLWEYENGLDLLVNDSALDADGDSLTNADEFAAGTNPHSTDTDGDGYHDDMELWLFSSDPLDANAAGEFLGLSDFTLASINGASGASGFESGLDLGRFFFEGAGSGLRSGGDSGQFLHKAATGNFSVTLKLNAGNPSEDFDLALIARESLGTTSKFIGLESQSNRRYYRYHRRAAVNSDLETIKHNYRTQGDRWMRLERLDDTLLAYASHDGESWVLVGSYSQALGETLLVGAFLDTGSKNKLRAVDVTFVEWKADQDGDRLWDDEELAFGTSLSSADTDGDGLSDYEELISLGTDPLVADAISIGEASYSSGGSAFTQSAGTWRANSDGSVVALDYRGSLDYSVQINSPGYYRLDLEVREGSEFRDASQFRILAYLGDTFVGEAAVRAVPAEATLVSFWLPWQALGNSSVRFEWIPVEEGASLRIDSIALSPLEFVDTNQAEAWESNKIADEFGLHESGLIGSYVSPYNLNGKAYDLNLVSIVRDSDATAFTPNRALSDSFHVDLPLGAKDGADAFSISSHNEAISESISVDWEIADFADLSLVDVRYIRPGDSLLIGWRGASDAAPVNGVYFEVFKAPDADDLTATNSRQAYVDLTTAPVDSVALSDFLAEGISTAWDAVVAGRLLHADGSGVPFTNADRDLLPVSSAPSTSVLLLDGFGLKGDEVSTVRFEEPGQYYVRATWRESDGTVYESILGIEAVDVELGATVAALVNFERLWTPDLLPEAVTVDADSHIMLSELFGASSREFDLLSASPVNGRIVARLPDTGAVVDIVEVSAIMDYSRLFGGSHRVIEVFADGTELVEFTLALGGDFPPDFQIHLTPISAGVLFEDGGIDQWITADQLDEVGRYRFRVTVPADLPSNGCHNYQLFQADTAIGTKI